MPDEVMLRHHDRNAIQKVHVYLNECLMSFDAVVVHPKMGHRVARPLRDHFVAGSTSEVLDLFQQGRSTASCLVGIDGPDEVEIYVDRYSREVKVQQVEGRASPERQLIPQLLSDRLQQHGQTKDSLQRFGAKSRRRCDAVVVATIRDRITAPA